MADDLSPVALPAKLPDIDTARLPEVYEQARLAIAECDRVDECQTWADKAAALASYYRQSKDQTLLNHAKKIRARATRRVGELLKEMPAAKPGPKLGGGPPTDLFNDGGLPTSETGRFQAAKDAGLSRDQAVAAIRVANVPEAQFEALVESDTPPTTDALADMGRRKQPTIEPSPEDEPPLPLSMPQPPPPLLLMPPPQPQAAAQPEVIAPCEIVEEQQQEIARLGLELAAAKTTITGLRDELKAANAKNRLLEERWAAAQPIVKQFEANMKAALAAQKAKPAPAKPATEPEAAATAPAPDGSGAWPLVPSRLEIRVPEPGAGTQLHWNGDETKGYTARTKNGSYVIATPDHERPGHGRPLGAYLVLKISGRTAKVPELLALGVGLPPGEKLGHILGERPTLEAAKALAQEWHSGPLYSWTKDEVSGLLRRTRADEPTSPPAEPVVEPEAAADTPEPGEPVAADTASEAPSRKPPGRPKSAKPKPKKTGTGRPPGRPPRASYLRKDLTPERAAAIERIAAARRNSSPG